MLGTARAAHIHGVGRIRRAPRAQRPGGTRSGEARPRAARAGAGLLGAGLALALLGGAGGSGGVADTAGSGATAIGTSGARVSVDADSGSSDCTANGGTRIAQTPPALAQLQSELAWGVSRGTGVVVAVVDSGVDARNPHLAGVLAGGVDLVGDGAGQNGYADLDGHGTAIAGQIAARTIDGSGVQGLAPEARILSVRVFSTTEQDARKAGYGPTIPRIAEGIRVAADANAQVINVSLSSASDAPELRDAVAYATARGSLVVASSGNADNSQSVEEKASGAARYPAGDPGALGSGAVDAAGAADGNSVNGPHVSIAAPGQNIVTSASNGIDCVYSSDAAHTSFSTAYVSAAAALVAAAHPQETPAQWKYRLEATAVRPDPDRRDDAIGWGVVQPYDAMTLAVGGALRGPESAFGGGTASPPADDQRDLALAHSDPASTLATTISIVGAVAAAAVLGVVGVLGYYRRRRRAEESPDEFGV
ncbi:S8 family serine peptidase [Schumannella soli]|uniref:S8 family serine peptidase n=1 Tax=Schumannella soli TaxID=2590779 RepID=A0A506Y6Z6_9MICO|nr:S8 family serine peptidase [Schumannella soli]TPW77832.1 S8 family serine peptidase [Schumannella soli]